VSCWSSGVAKRREKATPASGFCVEVTSLLDCNSGGLLTAVNKTTKVFAAAEVAI
jgi:hypothetical protein